MAPQLSYSIDIPAVSFPGQIADVGFKDVLTGLNVAAAIAYGLLAVVDSANTGGFDKLAVKVPAASGDIADGLDVGIVLADQARAQDPSVAAAVYPQNSAVPCCRKGRVWVQSESAVVDGSPVYGRYANGDGGTVKGQLSGVLDTSVVGNKLVPRAVWRGSTSAPGFAVVEIDFT